MCERWSCIQHTFLLVECASNQQQCHVSCARVNTHHHRCLRHSLTHSHQTISIEWKWNILTQFIRLVETGAADAALAASMRTNSSQSMRWEFHSHIPRTSRWCDANYFNTEKSPFATEIAVNMFEHENKWTEYAYAYAMNTICGGKVSEWVTDVGMAFITFGAMLS